MDNVDVTKIAVTGSGDTVSILAGTAAEAQVYYSYNSGEDWKRSKKEPTGLARTYVLMAPDTDLAYAATSGSESAFSISGDRGVTWKPEYPLPCPNLPDYKN